MKPRIGLPSDRDPARADRLTVLASPPLHEPLLLRGFQRHPLATFSILLSQPHQHLQHVPRFRTVCASATSSRSPYRFGRHRPSNGRRPVCRRSSIRRWRPGWWSSVRESVRTGRGWHNGSRLRPGSYIGVRRTMMNVKDRDPIRLPLLISNCPGRLEPVHLRHLDIHQYQIERCSAPGFHGFPSVVGDRHPMTGLPCLPSDEEHRVRLPSLTESQSGRCCPAPLRSRHQCVLASSAPTASRWPAQDRYRRHEPAVQILFQYSHCVASVLAGRSLRYSRAIGATDTHAMMLGVRETSGNGG